MKGVTANPFVVVLSVPVYTKVELMLYIFQKHGKIHCSYSIVIKLNIISRNFISNHYIIYIVIVSWSI